MWLVPEHLMRCQAQRPLHDALHSARWKSKGLPLLIEREPITRQIIKLLLRVNQRYDASHYGRRRCTARQCPKYRRRDIGQLLLGSLLRPRDLSTRFVRSVGIIADHFELGWSRLFLIVDHKATSPDDSYRSSSGCTQT